MLTYADICFRTSAAPKTLGQRKAGTPATPPADSERRNPRRQARGPADDTSAQSPPLKAYNLNADLSDFVAF